MNIPDEWAEPVAAALAGAFGRRPVDAIAFQGGGLSGAPVYRLQVAGLSYLMRLDRPREAGGPAHWHRCMRIAAAAGVAPPVLHADDGGVSIVAFVSAEAGRRYWTLDRSAILADLGRLVRRLHDAPPFPPLCDFLEAIRGQADRVAAAGLLSAGETAAALERFERVAAAYRRLEPQDVSSHNDLHPANLVHDGKRLWMVDWQAAFLADRYFDLAAIGSFLAREAGMAALLLSAYFGRPPDEAERARYYLARQLHHFCFGMTMLPTGHGARPAAVRPLDALHAALRSGEPLFDSRPGRVEYALARLQALLAGTDDPRFAEAVRLAR